MPNQMKEDVLKTVEGAGDLGFSGRDARDSARRRAEMAADHG
jgi:hypothetical protein